MRRLPLLALAAATLAASVQPSEARRLRFGSSAKAATPSRPAPAVTVGPALVVSPGTRAAGSSRGKDGPPRSEPFRPERLLIAPALAADASGPAPAAAPPPSARRAQNPCPAGRLVGAGAGFCAVN